MSPRRHLSLVLRFLAEPARNGRLVGNAEVVDTGEMVTIASADDLVELVTRLGGSPDPSGSFTGEADDPGRTPT